MLMQNFTLHSYVGLDGILHLEVPIGCPERHLEVTLTVQEQVLPVKNTILPTPRDSSEVTILRREGSVLVADGILLSDPTDLIQQQRQQRTAELWQWGGL